MSLELLEVHDNVLCMVYWTICIVWADSQVNYSTSTESNDELSNVFTLPSLSSTQDCCQQQRLGTPWQNIQQLDISSRAVSTRMNDGVLYYFMHWPITSKLSFVIVLLDKTTIGWSSLLIANVCQRSELLLITTPPNSVAKYSPTWHLG